jgi:hypothetical protein
MAYSDRFGVCANATFRVCKRCQRVDAVAWNASKIFLRISAADTVVGTLRSQKVHVIQIAVRGYDGLESTGIE